MKNTIQRYGLYGALSICVLFLLSLWLGDGLSYGAQEVIGYTTMVISLGFVFFGIKHFRDKENNGTVSFKKALVIGILISLITALAFGLLDFIYVKYINPGFMEEYYTNNLQILEDSLPAAEFEVKKAELESQKELFMNPVMSFVLMSVTVLMIGFIISLLSALILQRKT